jgi:hypothetical protein
MPRPVTPRLRAVGMLVIPPLLLSAACGGEEPSGNPQCRDGIGTGVASGTTSPPYQSCRHTWTCGESFEINCTAFVAGRYACECLRGGVREKSFSSLDACTERATAAKRDCGYDVN